MNELQNFHIFQEKVGNNNKENDHIKNKEAVKTYFLEGLFRKYEYFKIEENKFRLKIEESIIKGFMKTMILIVSVSAGVSVAFLIVITYFEN